MHLWHVHRYADRMVDPKIDAAFLARGVQEHWTEAKKFCFDFDYFCPEVGRAIGGLMRAVQMKDVDRMAVAVKRLDYEMTYCLAVQSQFIGDIRRDTVGSERFV